MARYRAEGAPGLQDRLSCRHTATGQLDPPLIARIEELRRERKWSARRILHHVRTEGHALHVCTVGRWLHRLGIARLGTSPEPLGSRAGHHSASTRRGLGRWCIWT